MRQQSSFETSIVRGRVMVFEGWRFVLTMFQS
jgi:hypothetical protein